MSYSCEKCGERRDQGCFAKGCPGIPPQHDELGALRARLAAAEAQRDALLTQMRRIADFTSETPGLSESGCGRLLAQIEHAAVGAIDAARKDTK